MVEYDMCVPVPLGVKSSNAPISVEREERGLGLDRAAWRVTKDLINDGRENLTLYVLKNIAEKDYNRVKLPGESKEVNRRVKEILNIEPTKSQSRFFRLKSTFRKFRRADLNQIKVNLDITDRQVKKETGFKTRNMLLAFTIIACHGDMAEVIHTTTKHLTWFEEWYLFL